MPTCPRSRKTQLRAIAARVRAARKTIANSRNELGRLTVPSDPAVIADAKLERALSDIRQRHHLVEAAGVVGFTVGYARVRGVETSEPCLTIYVTRKLSSEALERRGRRKFPRFIQVTGKRIRLDVVSLGRLQRHAFVGQSLSAAVGGTTRFGTIGARAVRLVQGTPVLITAMHVTGLRSFPDPGVPPVPIFVPGGGSTQIGQLLEGTEKGIDAAIVSVQTMLSDVLPSIGRLRGWRPVLLPGDRGTRVRMFGARSQRLMDGVIEDPLVDFPAFGLDLGIVVRGFDSVEGDSGAALVDPQNLVLGFLVGRTATQRRIFCPAGLVLNRLGCDIPSVQ